MRCKREYGCSARDGAITDISPIRGVGDDSGIGDIPTAIVATRPSSARDEGTTRLSRRSGREQEPPDRNRGRRRRPPRAGFEGTACEGSAVCEDRAPRDRPRPQGRRSESDRNRGNRPDDHHHPTTDPAPRPSSDASRPFRPETAPPPRLPPAARPAGSRRVDRFPRVSAATKACRAQKLAAERKRTARDRSARVNSDWPRRRKSRAKPMVPKEALASSSPGLPGSRVAVPLIRASSIEKASSGGDHEGRPPERVAHDPRAGAPSSSVAPDVPVPVSRSPAARDLLAAALDLRVDDSSTLSPVRLVEVSGMVREGARPSLVARGAVTEIRCSRCPLRSSEELQTVHRPGPEKIDAS